MSRKRELRNKRIALHQHQGAVLSATARRDELPKLYRTMMQEQAAWHYAMARYELRV